MKIRLSLLVKIVGVAVLLVALATVFVFSYGREQSWELLAGPPDLGAADLGTLSRRSWSNDALMCRDSFCPAALVDLPGSIYKINAMDLAVALDDAVVGEDHLRRVDDGLDPLYRRFVQRTPGLRFPDTIDVRFFPLSEDRSYMAVYSRSQMGYGDFGVNRERIQRWAGYLDYVPHDN
ncbi:MAG TPA: DUF1499 domain-containing protein [Afifellaceae bacterium]|nr:DUF1499 domain-containing protein [Afifellaceae bacterium]